MAVSQIVDSDDLDPTGFAAFLHCPLQSTLGQRKNSGILFHFVYLFQVLRCNKADISSRYLTAIREAATEYVAGIFRRLREHEYHPEMMRLYVVGGGGCMIKNFGQYDADRVTIIDDICATAKGYEKLSIHKLRKGGGIV